MTQNTSEKIKNVARLLKESRSIIFITGAGISAESGLPTYRGIGGFYNNTTTEEGIPIETVLAGQMLESNPALTWKYLSAIEKKSRDAKYNRAHEIIAQMEQHFSRVLVFTQNIDGFHHAAGSRNIIDIHGNMHKLLCAHCGWRTVVSDYSAIEIPPLCPECNNIARPDVVFFGEMLPLDKVQDLTLQLAQGFDIYFSIGTTSVFPYISQPIEDAKASGRPTVEINPSETAISDLVDIKISLGAVDALDKIWAEYKLQK